MDQLNAQPITLKTSQLSITEDDGTDADKSVRMETQSPTGWTPKTNQLSLNEDDRTVVDGQPVDLNTECEPESSFLYQYPTGTGNKQIRRKILLQTSPFLFKQAGDQRSNILKKLFLFCKLVTG
jgi:hypothetical protein